MSLKVSLWFLARLQLVGEGGVEACVCGFPSVAVPLDPRGNGSDRLRLYARRTTLSVAAARYQAGVFQHFKVARYCRLANRKRLRELVDGGLAACQPKQNRAARCVG